jgi:hypothetical protein
MIQMKFGQKIERFNILPCKQYQVTKCAQEKTIIASFLRRFNTARFFIIINRNSKILQNLLDNNLVLESRYLTKSEKIC